MAKLRYLHNAVVTLQKRVQGLDVFLTSFRLVRRNLSVESVDRQGRHDLSDLILVGVRVESFVIRSGCMVAHRIERSGI